MERVAWRGFDMATRDPVEDEALGLNCAWYSDVLLTLSEP